MLPLCLAEMVDHCGWGKTITLDGSPRQIFFFFSKGKVSKRKAVRSHDPSLSKKHAESFLTYKLPS